MKYRNVGKTGLKVSEIALGSWLTWGSSIDENSAKGCFNTALEHGINYIDSADVYARGEAELVLGNILQDETYNRRQLVIASKVFWPMSEDVNDRGLSRKHIVESIDGTLERLGLDYIDLYFCHRFDRHTPLEETVQAMGYLIDAGLVHYWGTSVWTAAQLERVIRIATELRIPPPSVEQPRYNMLDRHIELEIMETCAHNGIGLVVWSPLGQGILTGKYNEGVPEGSRGATTSWLQTELTDANLTKVRQLTQIAQNLGISMNQLALTWILRRNEVSSAIIGATNPDHVTSNAQAVDISLDSETLDKIEAILGNKPEMYRIYRPPW